MNGYLLKRKLSLITLLVVGQNLYSNAKQLPNCVYISSYHKGYEWSDGIEKSIKNILDKKCNIIQFDMDTKRNKDEDFKLKQGLMAKDLILKSNPKVVIVSDDNAAKYVLAKHFLNSTIPFVFCGINWTADEYKFSPNNTTGMIEITPIKQLFEQAMKITKGHKAIFIGDNTETDKKDLAYFEKYAKKMGVKLDSALVETSSEWKNRYLDGQHRYDFIILGHNSAIKDWNDDDIKKFIEKNGKKFSVTTYSWMVHFAHYGLTIRPQEQGEWAGNTSIAILNGYKVSNIAITSNKSWDSWVNMNIIKSSNTKLSRDIIEKAKKLD